MFSPAASQVESFIGAKKTFSRDCLRNVRPRVQAFENTELDDAKDSKASSSLGPNSTSRVRLRLKVQENRPKHFIPGFSCTTFDRSVKKLSPRPENKRDFYPDAGEWERANVAPSGGQVE